MSYGVVRVQKFRSGSVKGIQIHDRREKDGISHTNKDIDWSKTHLNYDLHFAQNENFNKAVKERVEQLNLKRSVRKDAVVMAQVLVTSDHAFFKRLSEDEQKQFFQDSYKFLKERYGKENVISATVHLDESTPHMHFNFVPITADGRLSAKSVLTRQSLIKQQDLFFEQVGKKYGLQRGEHGGNKIHLETAEFKRQMAIDKAIEADRKAQEALKELERVKGLIDDLKPLQAEYEVKKAYVRECDKTSEVSMAFPEWAQVKKSLFGKETVTVPKEKWYAKHISADEKCYLEKATEILEKNLEALRNTPTSKTVVALSQRVDELEKEKVQLVKKYENVIEKLQFELTKWECFMKSLPDELAKDIQGRKEQVFQQTEPSVKREQKKRGFSR